MSKEVKRLIASLEGGFVEAVEAHDYDALLAERDALKEDAERLEVVSDRAYRNGLQQGYNLGSIGDHERFHAAINSYSREIEGAGK